MVRRLSFKVTIVALFTVLTVGLSTAVLYLNYSRSSDVGMRTDEGLLEQVAGRVIAATEQMIEPLFSITNMAMLFPGVDAAGGANGDHPLQALMIAVLARYPQMVAIYIGNGNGDFYRVAEIESWDAA